MEGGARGGVEGAGREGVAWRVGGRVVMDERLRLQEPVLQGGWKAELRREEWASDLAHLLRICT